MLVSQPRTVIRQAAGTPSRDAVSMMDRSHKRFSAGYPREASFLVLPLQLGRVQMPTDLPPRVGRRYMLECRYTEMAMLKERSGGVSIGQMVAASKRGRGLGRWKRAREASVQGESFLASWTIVCQPRREERTRPPSRWAHSDFRSVSSPPPPSPKMPKINLDFVLQFTSQVLPILPLLPEDLEPGAAAAAALTHTNRGPHLLREHLGYSRG